MGPNILRFGDREKASEAAAERFSDVARRAIKTRDRFLVALAGGSTPREMYQLISRDPLRGRIAWPKVHCFFGDERAVPEGDDRSNYRMARDTLLDSVAIPRSQVHRMPADDFDHKRAARNYQLQIAKTFGVARDGTPPAFDLVVLGMGADGHTASLFPGSPTLDERRHWVAPAHSPSPPHERLTLTLPILNAARWVIVLAIGKSKAEAVAAALAGGSPKLPIQRVAPTAGELVWVIDDDAASRLRPTPNECPESAGH